MNPKNTEEILHAWNERWTEYKETNRLLLMMLDEPLRQDIELSVIINAGNNVGNGLNIEFNIGNDIGNIVFNSKDYSWYLNFPCYKNEWKSIPMISGEKVLGQFIKKFRWKAFKDELNISRKISSIIQNLKEDKIGEPLDKEDALLLAWNEKWIEYKET